MERPEKRLQFLESFLAAQKVSITQLADLMNVSRQNIHTYFRRDDMRLSYAQEIFNRLGYTLSISMEREGTSTSPILLDIESLVGQNGLTRLAFMRVAFKMYGISREDVANRLGINYAGVGRWFRVDDIAISYIFEIAELYDLTVKVTIKQKQSS